MAELVDGQTIDIQGLDANAERDLLLLLELLFRLVTLELRRREITLVFLHEGHSIILPRKACSEKAFDHFILHPPKDPSW